METHPALASKILWILSDPTIFLSVDFAIHTMDR